MKTLFIVRHAKSDQSFFGNDFDRPLNNRGKNDAPEMAKRLIDKNIKPVVLVASPAARAKATAEAFAENLKINLSEIVFVSALYHAASEVFYDVISKLPDELQHVAVFSHNPGITHFVNSLDSGAKIDNMPTCGIFAVSVDIKNWTDFNKAKKEFLFFDYPKNI